MEINQTLEHLGLTEKEAKVYLALLQAGSGSVPALSIKSGVKRPTTYLILEELRQKGLATLLPKKKKALYSAQSPEILLEEQKEKEETIRQKMPELMAIYNSKKEKPKVTFYQGEDNVIKLYDEIFKENKVDIFGSIKAIAYSEAIRKQLQRNLAITREKKIKVRELLEAEEKSIEFSKNASETYEIKIVPKDCLFPTDNIIFGNKLAIFSYKDTPQAVVIESSDVAITYQSAFEILWKSV